MAMAEYNKGDDVSLDLGGIMAAVWRAKRWIVPLVLVTGVATFLGLNVMPPKYKTDARLLIESREINVGSSDRGVEEEKALLDEQGIASQVQLMSSRDLVRSVIRDLKLTDHREFGGPPGVVAEFLAMVKLGKDVSLISQEQRALDEFMKRMSVYQIEKTRVITVEFSATDPKLAASIVNAVVDRYLVLQAEAKRGQAAQATKWLEQEIETLRKRVADAEGRVEQYRASTGLFVGQNNTSLDQQQLAEINTQITNARAQRSDAEARARQLRTLLNSNSVLETATEIQNSANFQRLRERAGAIQARIAELSTTLLPGHPSIQALQSQRNDIDSQMRLEARRVLSALESDVRVADGRLKELTGQLNELKAQSAVSNQDDIQLRALEREARAQRELLETFLGRYRKEVARQNADVLPADARVIANALVPVEPYFPKVVPITVVVTLGMFLLCCTLVVLRELVNGNALRGSRSSRQDYGYDAPAEVTAVAPALAGVGPAFGPAVDPHAMVSGFGTVDAVTEGPDYEERAFESVRDVWSALSASGEDASRLLVTSASDDDLIAHAAALSLARHIAATGRKVIVLDLIGRPEDLGQLVTRQRLPGMAALFSGEAGFAEIIVRDPRSRAHIVPSGGVAFTLDRLASPRFRTILNALEHTYDHVILDVGPLVDDDALADLVADVSQIVLAADANMADTRTRLAYEALVAGGIVNVSVLTLDVGGSGRSARAA